MQTKKLKKNVERKLSWQKCADEKIPDQKCEAKMSPDPDRSKFKDRYLPGSKITIRKYTTENAGAWIINILPFFEEFGRILGTNNKICDMSHEYCSIL